MDEGRIRRSSEREITCFEKGMALQDKEPLRY